MSAQSMEALAYANEVRIARAKVKAKVRAGRMSAGEALREPSCARMRVFELLRLLPAARKSGGCVAGRSAVNRTIGFLGGLQITPFCLVGQLTERQVREIAGVWDA